MVETRTSYLICTTPRTGSWLLCDLLSQTGLAGFPQEYLLSHTPFDPDWGLPRQETLDGYLGWVRDQATGDNGVCGIKLHWSQLCHLCRILEVDAAGAVGYLADRLPDLRLIRLTRRDSLRQVLSYQRAISEQRWWRLVEDRPEDQADADPPWQPDFAEVSRLRRLLAEHEDGWAAMLRTSPRPALQISYEQLIADLGGTLAQVLCFLGIEAEDARAASEAAAPTLLRQSDEETELQVHRYLSWCYDRPVTATAERLEAIS